MSSGHLKITKYNSCFKILTFYVEAEIESNYNVIWYVLGRMDSENTMRKYEKVILPIRERIIENFLVIMSYEMGLEEWIEISQE